MRSCTLLVPLLLTLFFAPSLSAAEPELLDVQRIADDAPHSAFTDLVRFKGDFYLGFREGKDHVSDDGAMRILRSADAEDWETVARFTDDAADLRDAAFAVTPDDELVFLTAAALHEPAPHTHQSIAWITEDGETWSDRYPVADANVWLWSLAFHPSRKLGLGFGYSVDNDDRFVRLYRTEDGRSFQTLVEDADAPADYPNESAIVYLEDEADTALALLRQDPGPAMLGSATPPYTDWNWEHLDRRVGGPSLIQLPDGRLIAVVRLYDEPGVRTAICELDRDALTLNELLTLPSGGDTSYPGLVFDEDAATLYVSYYASHESRTAIYLARVRFPAE